MLSILFYFSLHYIGAHTTPQSNFFFQCKKKIYQGNTKVLKNQEKNIKTRVIESIGFNKLD
jgi:hypothetical protein